MHTPYLIKQTGASMIFDHLRKKITAHAEPKTITIEESDLECEVTDEIERALWDLKEDLDLPTEEVIIAVEGRKELKVKRQNDH